MKRAYLFLTLLCAIIAQVTIASSSLDEVIIPDDAALRRGRLNNSLTYYIRHNAKPKGQANFYIITDVGAIQEDDDQQGLAHFLEHMAFNGTRDMPGKMMIEYLESSCG
ncbi:MAG: insulinase family protein, partial [Rikenellaceae bacterium]